MANIAKTVAGGKVPCYDEIKGLMECMVVSGRVHRRGRPCAAWHPHGAACNWGSCAAAHPPPPSAQAQRSGLTESDAKCTRYHTAAVMCMQQASMKSSNTRAEVNTLITVGACAAARPRQRRASGPTSAGGPGAGRLGRRGVQLWMCGGRAGRPSTGDGCAACVFWGRARPSAGQPPPPPLPFFQ
jgi:hypothetical protein